MMHVIRIRQRARALWSPSVFLMLIFSAAGCINEPESGPGITPIPDTRTRSDGGTARDALSPDATIPSEDTTRPLDCVGPSCPVECEEPLNACGGCGRLEHLPSEGLNTPCGPCGRDVLVCGPDGLTLVCSGATACASPRVVTHEAHDITGSSAILSGELLELGASPVFEHGFCFGPNPSPALDGGAAQCSRLGALTAPQRFTLGVSGLTPRTRYFVRAYARNSDGTAYGAEITWSTPSNDLAVFTLRIERGNDPETIHVYAQLNQASGTPVPTAYGVCLGTTTAPTFEQPQTTCVNSEHADDQGAFMVTFPGLKAGATYFARSFVKVGSTPSFGTEMTLTLVPLRPEISEITNGVDPLKVSLTWGAVEFATEYDVFRDNVKIASVPAERMGYDDFQASPAQLPTVNGLTLTASTTLSDRVEVAWDAAESAPGPRHNYSVLARNHGGISPISEARQGARGPWPVTGYEIAMDDGAFVAVGDDEARHYADRAAPAGAVVGGQLSASQGDSSEFVLLSVSGVEALSGDEVAYRVRAIAEAAGSGEAGRGPASTSVIGQRAAPALSFVWQRSTTASAEGDFESLAETDASHYEDLNAPLNEVVRFYWVQILGAEQPLLIGPVSGFRGVNLPVLAVGQPTLEGYGGAAFSGSVTSMGSVTSLLEHGYCYGTTGNPEFSPDSPACVSLGARSTFGAMTTHAVSGLQGHTVYFVRAFATFTRADVPYVVYSPVAQFLTKPDQPARPTVISPSMPTHPIIIQGGAGSAADVSFDIYRNGSYLATVQGAPQGFTYSDASAPAAPLPTPVTNLRVTDKSCADVSFAWGLPPLPAPGASVTYTLVAGNSSGKSQTSLGATGNRPRYVVDHIRFSNLSANTMVGLSAATTTFTTGAVRAATVNAASVWASQNAPSHPDYILVKHQQATKGPTPTDHIQVSVVTQTGAVIPASAILAQRPKSCPLVRDWQRTTTTGVWFTLDNGASSLDDTFKDYSARKNTAFRYRTRIWVQGDYPNAQFSDTYRGIR